MNATMTPREAWQATRNQLQLQMDRGAFETYVAGVRVAAFEGDAFILEAPTPQVRDYLDTRLGRVLARGLSDALRRPVTVEVVVAAPPQAPPEAEAREPRPPVDFRSILPVVEPGQPTRAHTQVRADAAPQATQDDAAGELHIDPKVYGQLTERLVETGAGIDAWRAWAALQRWVITPDGWTRGMSLSGIGRAMGKDHNAARRGIDALEAAAVITTRRRNEKGRGMQYKLAGFGYKCAAPAQPPRSHCAETAPDCANCAATAQLMNLAVVVDALLTWGRQQQHDSYGAQPVRSFGPFAPPKCAATAQFMPGAMETAQPLRSFEGAGLQNGAILAELDAQGRRETAQTAQPLRESGETAQAVRGSEPDADPDAQLVRESAGPGAQELRKPAETAQPLRDSPPENTQTAQPLCGSPRDPAKNCAATAQFPPPSAQTAQPLRSSAPNAPRADFNPDLQRAWLKAWGINAAAELSALGRPDARILGSLLEWGHKARTGAYSIEHARGLLVKDIRADVVDTVALYCAKLPAATWTGLVLYAAAQVNDHEGGLPALPARLRRAWALWAKRHTDARQAGDAGYLQLEHVPAHLLADASRVIAADPSLARFIAAAARRAGEDPDADWLTAALIEAEGEGAHD